MGYLKLPFLHTVLHAARCLPSRRSMLCAGAAVAILAGPVGFAAANAVTSSPAAIVAAADKSGAVEAGAVKSAKHAAAGAKDANSRQAAAAKAKAAPGKPAPAAAKPAAPAPAKPAPPAAAKPAAPAAKPAAAAVAPKPAGPYPGVTMAQLEPHGLYGYQEHFSANSEQWQNARTIVEVASRRGMSPYAAVIAVATALQESTLRNLTVAVDADSLGLFQQRPSMGWGSPRQLTDPAYATGAFLSALKQYAPGYDSMPLWRAAQNTQRSGFPTAYARWQDQAARMVQQIAAG